MQTTLTQISELLATIYAGLFIGLVYEALRLFRRVLRAGKWLTALFDLLFWAIAALVAALALFRINGGELRLYSVVGFLSGALLFIIGVSPALASVFRFVARPFQIIWRNICKNRVFLPKEEGDSPEDVEY